MKNFEKMCYAKIQKNIQDRYNKNYNIECSQIVEEYNKNIEVIQKNIISEIGKNIDRLRYIFEYEFKLLPTDTVKKSYYNKIREDILYNILELSVLLNFSFDKENRNCILQNKCSSYCVPVNNDINGNIANIMNVLYSMYLNKNTDYGNSFKLVRDVIPNSILVRLYDKYYRLNTLIKTKNNLVKGEKIEDTILDLPNYCILELIEMYRV